MREKIRMNSTAGTGHFYTTDKNKRTTPDKLEMKKYDPEEIQTRIDQAVEEVKAKSRLQRQTA